MKRRSANDARITRRAALGIMSVAPAGLAQIAATPGRGPARQPRAQSQPNQPVLEPLIPFRQFNRYGYKDRVGKLVIKPIFEGAGAFFDPLGRQRSLAWVRVGQKYGYIDRQGQFLIRPAFESIREFSEGLAAVQLNGRFGFINETAKMVVEAKYEEVEPFSNGLAAVRLDGKTGWIDRRGGYYSRRPGSGPIQ